MKEILDALQFGATIATLIMLVVVYAWLRGQITALRLPSELQDDEADPMRAKEAAESWRRETLSGRRG